MRKTLGDWWRQFVACDGLAAVWGLALLAAVMLATGQTGGCQCHVSIRSHSTGGDR